MTVDPFTMRDDLAHLHQLARAERVGPDALLALTLNAVLAATEPTTTTSVGVGGRGSLNYLVALVGPSGAGKGTVEAVAAEAVTILDHAGMPVHTPEFPIGSGEGMASAYRARGTAEDEPHARTRAVFNAPEIDRITAISSRTGSTLTAALRQAWSGEALGAQNAAAENTSVVPRHSYRWCAVLGVQPRRAGALLAEADGGLPQRVLWAPVGDPDAPDQKPAHPGPLTVRLPRLTGQVSLNVAPSIRAEYDLAQLDRLRTSLDADAIDGHTRYVRLKTSAALALMDGRTVIGVDDWTVAGAIVERSTATREEVRRILNADQRDALREKARERVTVSLDAEDHREVEQLQRVRSRILAALDKQPEMTHAEVRRSIRYELRDRAEHVLNAMTVAGEIVARNYGEGPVYTLAACTVHDPYTAQNAA